MSSGNRGSGPSGLVPQSLSVLLSALMVLGPTSAWALSGESTAATSGVLSVASDPAGASVYVDGQFVGATPITLSQLSAGDHRLRVAKGGFLENGRIVRIAAGRTSDVAVKLTPHNGAVAESAQIVTGGGGGGSNKKWLWIGLAGGGAAVAAIALTGRNKAPTAGSVVASPATALQGATSVTFTAQGASDPDGDALTFTWDFGDGTTGTGASPTKVYTGSGTFTVTVTVSDGKKSATATGTVTVRNLTGTWRGTLGPFGTATLVMTQSGNNVSGTYNDCCFFATVSGTVSSSAPRVRLTINYGGGFLGTFNAEPSSDVNSVSGTYSEPGLTTSFTITRQ